MASVEDFINPFHVITGLDGITIDDPQVDSGLFWESDWLDRAKDAAFVNGFNCSHK
jgi:hypothetical protein